MDIKIYCWSNSCFQVLSSQRISFSQKTIITSIVRMLGFLFHADVKETRGQGMYGKEIGKIQKLLFFSLSLSKFHLDRIWNLFLPERPTLLFWIFSYANLAQDNFCHKFTSLWENFQISKWVSGESKNWSSVINALFGSNLKFDLSRTDSPVWFY